MKCNKCHKEIKEPLQLYTGTMACPKCKNSMNNYPKSFEITDPRANEFFTLSELFYHYSICKSAQLGAVSPLIDKCSLSAEKMIKKSVQYCQQAVNLGHPEAFWRMAFFYDKDYVEKDKTELVRCRIAANMYLALISSPERQFLGYGASNGEEETTALKARAASDLVSILGGMPQNDKKLYTNALVEYGYITNDEAKELCQGTDKNGGAELLTMLAETTSRLRAPLFGVITVKKEILAAIAEEITSLKAVKNRKIDFMFIPLNRDNLYDVTSIVDGIDPYHVARSTVAAINEGIGYAIDKAEENCCVFFFNKAGKHRFYSSGSKKNRIQRLLNQDVIDRLISYAAGRSFVFYDDDVFVKNGRADRIITDIDMQEA